MKLSELELSAEEAAALHGFLQTLIAQNNREAERQAEQQRLERIHDRYSEKLIELATITASLHGDLAGISGGYAAQAAWESLCDSTAFFSYLDVHEYFQPDADWSHLWSDTYLNTIDRMRTNRLSPITVQQASQAVDLLERADSSYTVEQAIESVRQEQLR